MVLGLQCMTLLALELQTFRISTPLDTLELGHALIGPAVHNSSRCGVMTAGKSPILSGVPYIIILAVIVYMYNYTCPRVNFPMTPSLNYSVIPTSRWVWVVPLYVGGLNHGIEYRAPHYVRSLR